MLVFRNIINDKFEYPIEKVCDIDKLLYFDIETTGLSRKYCKVYLIGCMYYQSGKFHLIQWFAENFNDEANVLMAFDKFMKDFNTIIHFNGNSFDIPFVKARGLEYNIDFDFERFKSIDLYKNIYPIKKIFQLENHKQKTFEDFLGIKRNDPFSGKDLIHLYKTYVERKDEKLLIPLLLHNKEDVHYMGYITSLLAYTDIFNNKYSDISFSFNDYKSEDGDTSSELIISATLDNPVPVDISYNNYPIYFRVQQNKLFVTVKIQYGTLKLFYDNYKDYYYLPQEDRAIHKSVSSFVDPKHRIKATSQNCYEKISGSFLIVYNSTYKNLLKLEKNDNTGYIRTSDLDENNIDKYLKNILDNL